MGGGASAPAMWEFEKKQMTAQISLLSTQLEAETSSRIEAQVYAWVQCCNSDPYKCTQNISYTCMCYLF